MKLSQNLLAAAFLIAASPALADPASEAKDSYTVEIASETTREAKVGEKGKVVVHIRPKEKIHVHPQAPLKIKAQASNDALTLEKTELGRNDAIDPKSDAPKFAIPFTATKAGKADVKADLDFFICSDTWCVKQIRSLTIPVSIK